MSRALMISRELKRRQRKRLVDRRRALRGMSAPFDLPDREFVANFRLSKECVESLCNELSPFLVDGCNKRRIGKKLRILTALSFFGMGSYQQNIGTSFIAGMSQTSVSTTVQEVVEALNHPLVVARHIKFPQTQQEREYIKLGFMEKFGIPGVLGCVDGTHVAMVRPRENEHEFFNRKGYHSRNVQIVCDHELNILHVDASFGGAAHDSFVWNSSYPCREMQQLHEQGESVWLLGDQGYSLRPYLMTPITNAVDGTAEAYYTELHVRARNTVERCIGVLKNRWRCLMAHRVLHYDHIKVAKIVNACCVLHNIANRNRVAEPVFDADEIHHDLERQNIANVHPADHHQAGETARSELVQRIWAAR